MGRPCVCDGSNESCRFCNGNGVLPDSLDSISGHPLYEFSAHNDNQTEAPSPNHHSGFLPAEFVLGPSHKGRNKSHKSKVHKSSLKSPQHSGSVQPEPLPSDGTADFLSTFGQCPSCGFRFLKGHLF